MSTYPTCPYCGAEHRDGGESFVDHVDETVIECLECEMEYTCTRHVDVSYESNPIKPIVDPQEAKDAAAERRFEDEMERREERQK